MNIRDQGMWPATLPFPLDSDDLLLHLFERRRLTMLGFAELEAARGVLVPGTSFATSKGQEMLRILLFRILEEVVESYDATDRDHVCEEMIDALNYAWTIPLFEQPQAVILPKYTELVAQLRDTEHFANSPMLYVEVATTAIGVARLTDRLRNRAWMNHAQDVYFNGNGQLLDLLEKVTKMVFHHFMSWNEFVRFFIAKDNVLQFRLRSKY